MKPLSHKALAWLFYSVCLSILPIKLIFHEIIFNVEHVGVVEESHSVQLEYHRFAKLKKNKKRTSFGMVSNFDKLMILLVYLLILYWQIRLIWALKTREEEIKKLRESDRLKNKWFTNFSQSLLHPISVIKGLAPKLSQLNNGELKESVNHINNSSAQLSSLTQELLEVVKTPQILSSSSSLDLDNIKLPSYDRLINSSTVVQQKHTTKILLGSYHAGMIFYLSRLLHHRYELTIAKSFSEVDNLSKEQFFDLIIIDIVANHFNDSCQLCLRLKHAFYTAHIPVILITNCIPPEYRLTGLAHGADTYMVKPIEEKELLIAIDRLLDSRQKLKAYYQRNVVQALVMEIRLSPSDQELLDKLHQTMEQHLTDRRFGVIQMATCIGKSTTSFNTWMHNITNTTPAIYLSTFRLKAARTLVLNTQDTIDSIALQTGFTDGTYLTKKYKKYFHYTPRQERQQRLSCT